MSPWSKPIEVERLAEARADVDFEIPLAELPGLKSVRGGVTGSVSGRVHFAARHELVVAQLTLTGSARLECQRCMQVLQLPLSTHVAVALLTSEEQAQRVPEDLEPVLAPGGRISIGELVTEELLLSLPIVPLHEAEAGCVSGPPPAERQGETHKPFARLAELLKR